MKKLLYILLLLGTTVQAQLIGVVASQGSSASDPDVYPQENAASLSDDNATTGWGAANESPTIAWDGTGSYDGTYHIKITQAGGTLNVTETSFPTQSGKTYDVSIWAKRGSQGTTQQFRTWINVASGFATTNITSTTWTEYTFTVVPTTPGTDIDIRVYPGRNGAIGDIVHVDKIVVTEYDTP